MAESTATAIAIPNQQNFEAGLEAEKPEDTRAPVGLDAGAPAVTADAEDDGWHGGAEDDGKRQVDKAKEKERERQTAEEPKAGEKPQVEVKEMELDDEAKRLAREAMKAVEESVE
jgi:dolichyl-phosphate-mannose-protein mannosyltransferase